MERIRAISQPLGPGKWVHLPSKVLSITGVAGLEEGRCFKVCEFEWYVKLGRKGELGLDLDFGSLWNIFEIQKRWAGNH